MPYKDPAKNQACKTRWLRAWRAAHPERATASATYHYQKNVTKRRAYGRRYYAEHPEHCRARNRAWHATHPEEVRLKNARRRGRIAQSPRNDLTAAQWTAIKRAFDYCCAYCGARPRRLEKDHITPVIAQGSLTLWNIVPACRSCNGKKYTGPPLCPVQPLLLTVDEQTPAQREAHAARRRRKAKARE